MRLEALTLQNIRRYRSRTVIDIDDLTGFIGCGDAGKSTSLEALDIFFEGGVIKIDRGDACISGEARDVRIGAIFTDRPEKLDLDRGAHTTLKNECLTRETGTVTFYACVCVLGNCPETDSPRSDRLRFVISLSILSALSFRLLNFAEFFPVSGSITIQHLECESNRLGFISLVEFPLSTTSCKRRKLRTQVQLLILTFVQTKMKL